MFSSVVMGMPKINRTGRKVVVLDLATGQIADDGVSPVGQFNCQTFDFAAIELGFALNGRRQPQPLAGSMDSSDILDLGLYLNDMTQSVVLSFIYCRPTATGRWCAGETRKATALPT